MDHNAAEGRVRAAHLHALEALYVGHHLASMARRIFDPTPVGLSTKKGTRGLARSINTLWVPC